MGFVKQITKKMVKDPKTGKSKLRTTKVDKTKTTGNNAYSTEKARLEHERIKADTKVKMSKLSMQQANVAHIAEQAGATIRQFAKGNNQSAALANYQNSKNYTQPSSAAEQATRGGLDSGETRREDDEGSAGTW